MEQRRPECPVARIGLDSPFVGVIPVLKPRCSARQWTRGDLFGKNESWRHRMALGCAWSRVDRFTYRNLPNLPGFGPLGLLLSAAILDPSSLFQIPALCAAVLLDWAGYRG